MNAQEAEYLSRPPSGVPLASGARIVHPAPTGWLQAVWISSALATTGVVTEHQGYPLHRTHIGTSPSIGDLTLGLTTSPPPNAPSDAHAGVVDDASLGLSYAEQVQEFLAALSLNKSQFADIMGVSRPTLYDWLDGKEPNLANAERLRMLLRVVQQVGATSTQPIAARFVKLPLVENAPSLLELLTNSAEDTPALLELAERALELSTAARTRRQTREKHLEGQGFDVPTTDERREQLARNLAMRDWPKT